MMAPHFMCSSSILLTQLPWTVSRLCKSGKTSDDLHSENKQLHLNLHVLTKRRIILLPPGFLIIISLCLLSQPTIFHVAAPKEARAAASCWDGFFDPIRISWMRNEAKNKRSSVLYRRRFWPSFESILVVCVRPKKCTFILCGCAVVIFMFY